MSAEQDLRDLQAGYLTSVGWLNSRSAQSALDASGPVPWFTYPAIRFIRGLVRQHWRVLEYGSGNSSIWWASQSAEVVSVEHDPVFAQSLRQRGLLNVTVIERTMDDPLSLDLQSTLRDEYFPSRRFGKLTADPTRNYRAGLLDVPYQAYAAVGLEYPPGYFDAIVVDGMARVLTAWVAARQLSQSGVVIFDNSDREEYEDGYALLAEAGFARIDFWGMGPINPYEWCTSVFLRSLPVPSLMQK